VAERPQAIERTVERMAGLSEGVAARLPGLDEPARQSAVLGEAANRPWPLPERPWFMAQTWHDLLFAHWPIPRQRLVSVIPPQLQIESHSGSAWIGVTPFLVSGLRLRGTIPVPLLSRFPELNVRTYVTVKDKPGIYFLSLDAASRSAVEAARRLYRLPYFHARMRRQVSDWGVDFSARRISADGPPAEFAASFSPTGRESPAAAGSLEHFLTERYCLYTLDQRGRVLRGEIHHPPWPLRPAVADLAENTMAAPFGIELNGEPLLHFAARQDVVLWRIAPVDE
jgi:uncharacterized protein